MEEKKCKKMQSFRLEDLDNHHMGVIMDRYNLPNKSAAVRCALRMVALRVQRKPVSK